jgi:alkanesulfonate monooxygenase SsuD/methylene tetrahydromethanopterin reductase-like flavin-dependent oxidoreductase (luciferase family)
MPMGDDLRFGVITLQNLPWEQEVSRWRHIEELGFYSVWLADHFVDYTRPREPWYDCWTLLAALASQTRSIRVGTLVSNVF